MEGAQSSRRKCAFKVSMVFYFLSHFIIFTDIGAFDQDGVAVGFISTHFQIKGELCLGALSNKSFKLNDLLFRGHGLLFIFSIVLGD